MNDRWRVIDGKATFVQKQTNATTLMAFLLIHDGIKYWSQILATKQKHKRVLSMSFAVEDGSYLRINNITLGYTIPQRYWNILKFPTSGFLWNYL